MNDEPVENPETNKPTKYFIVIVGLIFAAILLYLVFSLMQKPVVKPNTVDYDYFTFEEIGGLWQTYIQLDNQVYEGMFRFNPLQVENVSIIGNFTGFRKTPIYITFDPNASSDQFKYLALAASELTLHVVRALNFSVEAACTRNESDACFNRSIVTCADDASVIYLVPDPPAQIALDGDCVVLSGEGFDLLKSVDRLLFQWYKIMKKS